MSARRRHSPLFDPQWHNFQKINGTTASGQYFRMTGRRASIISVLFELIKQVSLRAAMDKFAMHVAGQCFNVLAKLFDQFGQLRVLLKQYEKLL